MLVSHTADSVSIPGTTCSSAHYQDWFLIIGPRTSPEHCQACPKTSTLIKNVLYPKGHIVSVLTLCVNTMSTLWHRMRTNERSEFPTKECDPMCLGIQDHGGQFSSSSASKVKVSALWVMFWPLACSIFINRIVKWCPIFRECYNRWKAWSKHLWPFLCPCFSWSSLL